MLGGLLLGVVNLLSRAGTRDEAHAIAEAQTGGGAFEVHRLTDTVSRAASEQLLIWSGGALLVIALCAVAVGWWTAGRVLRPVHEMTARARRLSERTLHERLAVRGPDDELKELGDTIDALLGRLEAAFESQRRFIANASHELRTPLATQRAAIQVGLDDSVGVKQVLLDSNRGSERLIEGLLLLARSERGLEQREDVPLGEVVAEECEAYGVTARVSARVVAGAGAGAGAGGGGGRGGGEVVVRGSRVLLAQLTRNLVANAVTYNVPGGLVDVAVDVDAAGGVLTVANTGPVIADADVPGLFEPFRRGEGRDRTGPGAGLGLSIVRSVAVAHGGTATAVGRDGGGLVVTVRLPVADQAPVAS
ncbi:sensor histidine kinase [Streptomyces sp. NRRL S-118]|uniref:sensor histidine kinase n=1 Tax=Streptomyces sp. NRRL S-118 TaxID=1463881 RepID=UPI000B329C63|nr:HAMP domain-containing sensor histidine kinase [Streptomyces sp. NRRL S-118]